MLFIKNLEFRITFLIYKVTFPFFSFMIVLLLKLLQIKKNMRKAIYVSNI